MNHEKVQAAANLIWRCWNQGDAIDTLPYPMRPMTPAEGYAIQAMLEQRSSKPLYGWKIAATSVMGQEILNVPGPLAGRVLAERAFDDGATLVFGANRMRVIEPEFAFRMGRDLPPRDAAYSPEEITEAAASLHPALEIPDSRFRVYSEVGAPQLIADNACGHEFVLGPAAPEDWRKLDLAEQAVQITVEGSVSDAKEGAGKLVLSDPRVALAWIATELSRLGETIRAGQIITTGTCTPPPQIGPDCSVSADFGVVGSVSCRFG